MTAQPEKITVDATDKIFNQLSDIIAICKNFYKLGYEAGHIDTEKETLSKNFTNDSLSASITDNVIEGQLSFDDFASKLIYDPYYS